MNIIDYNTQDNKFYKVPIVIDVILYKYNYIDNIIISQLKKSAFIMSNNNYTNFSVSANEFKHIFHGRFNDEISKINMVPAQNLPNNVNSIYFLNNIFENFANLEMINVHVSENRHFSRLFNINNQSIIGFDYKIKQGILDYPKYISPDLLDILTNFIHELDLVEIRSFELDPYYIVSARSLMSKLNVLQETNPTVSNDVIDLIDLTYEMVEPKLEEDNTFLILKLDFPH